MKGEGGEYSDSGRLASLDVGCQIAKEHFWLGAGSGNLKKEVGQKYREKYPDYVETIYDAKSVFVCACRNRDWRFVAFYFYLLFSTFLSAQLSTHSISDFLHNDLRHYHD